MSQEHQVSAQGLLSLSFRRESSREKPSDLMAPAFERNCRKGQRGRPRIRTQVNARDLRLQAKYGSFTCWAQ